MIRDSTQMCGVGPMTNKSKYKTHTEWVIEGIPIRFEAVMLEHIATLPAVTEKIKELWPEPFSTFEGVIDTYPRKEANVDLLLGMNCLTHLMTENTLKAKNLNLLALGTKAGYVLCGMLCDNQSCEEKSISMFTMEKDRQTEAPVDLDQILTRFWNCEHIGISAEDSQMSADDEEAIKTFNEELQYREGKYFVPLFLKSNRPYLECNVEAAKYRLKCVENRFRNDPEGGQQVREEIKKLISNQDVEELDPSAILDTSKNKFYLPMVIVIEPERETSQVRPTFDGSSTDSRGVSLNDILHSGPKLQNDLSGIILRFRLRRVTLSGDISRMFLSVSLLEKYRDFCRFLWRDLQSDKPIRVFRFTKTPFGLKDSPSKALMVTHHHLDTVNEKYPKESKDFKKNSYVDDYLGSYSNEEEAKKMYKASVEMLASGNMTIRKFVSNSKAVMESIPENLHSKKGSLIFNTNEDNIPKSSTLGVQYMPDEDNFVFEKYNGISMDSKPITKRTVSSLVSRIFDPIGLIAWFLIIGKLLLRQCWQVGVEWDQNLGPEISEKFTKWKNSLQFIQSIKIPRWVTKMKPTAFAIHSFSDASLEAIGAAVYLYTEHEDGTTCQHLLMSKTRPAPTKPITLPRLELYGCLIAARLTEHVKLQLDIKINRTIYFSDSQIALAWIRADTGRWKVWVANRCEEIKNKTNPADWKYVPTRHNPADILTHGSYIEEMTEKKLELFYQGPSVSDFSQAFGGEKTELTAKQKEAIDKEAKKSGHLLMVKEMKINTIKDTNTFWEWTNILQRYSNLEKCLRLTVYTKRIIDFGWKNWTEIAKPIEVKEMEEAEQIWVRVAQQMHYADEIAALKQGEEIESHSQLIKLNPFYDKTLKLLRIGGRVEESDLIQTQQIILPKKSEIATKIIKKIHNENYHPGPEWTLTRIRQKYWLPQGRSTIIQTTKKCVPCQKRKNKPAVQQMAKLPSSRTLQGDPFTRVGLDAAGPFVVKSNPALEAEETKKKKKKTKPNSNGENLMKVWILLFVDFLSRGVHLEVVQNLTADSIMNAIRRTVSRRGQPELILSDNALSFHRTNKDLKNLFRKVNLNDITQNLLERRIKWEFIKPGTPHQGGMYERIVRSIKTPLKKAMNRKTLNLDEFMTLTCEVEAYVNSRPLAAPTADIRDEARITPARLMLGRDLTFIPSNLPESEGLKTKAEMKERYKHRKKVRESLWRLFANQYLQELMGYSKWTKKTDNFKVSDVVLITDELVGRPYWPLGIIEEVFPGRDGLVRSVVIRTDKGAKMKRGISKLVKLELDN